VSAATAIARRAPEWILFGMLILPANLLEDFANLPSRAKRALMQVKFEREHRIDKWIVGAMNTADTDAR
jgi:hypothetical protein